MVSKTLKIEDLMDVSGVKFGTSGARGLVSDMTDEVCYTYTLGFLQYLERQGEIEPGESLAIGGDFRPSTDRIMTAAGMAVSDRGYRLESCGKQPSPAMAYYGLVRNIATIMVTGSHIPDDRNGIKYTKKQGEILKNDEAMMKSQVVTVPGDRFDDNGKLVARFELPEVNSQARDLYIKRYLDYFPTGCLEGLKIGVYQHSAVGRDIMVAILSGLGAKIVKLGFSESFVPVDTEAIRLEDIKSAEAWAVEYELDAIVSTDGDSDRPLVGDECGKWLRGDVAGILCAKYLNADTVVTPVSCNTAVEKSGWFKRVIRTKIGSPYVIEGMQKAEAESGGRVVGYEANGGFLLESSIESGGRKIRALPTRDAVIVHLAVLLLAKEQDKQLSELADELPARFTYSDRLKNFPVKKSKAKIQTLYAGDKGQSFETIESVFGPVCNAADSVDLTDGLRITFKNLEVIHLRPSGNAPEFRCYTEADSEARASEINRQCIQIMETWR